MSSFHSFRIKSSPDWTERWICGISLVQTLTNPLRPPSTQQDQLNIISIFHWRMEFISLLIKLPKVGFPGRSFHKKLDQLQWNNFRIPYKTSSILRTSQLEDLIFSSSIWDNTKSTPMVTTCWLDGGTCSWRFGTQKIRKLNFKIQLFSSYDWGIVLNLFSTISKHFLNFQKVFINFTSAAVTTISLLGKFCYFRISKRLLYCLVVTAQVFTTILFLCFVSEIIEEIISDS